MSQQEDDLRALAKIMDFLRAISIVLVVANLYYFTRVETVDSGWFYTTADKILNNFNRACGLFCNTFPSKLFSLLLLGVACFGTKGVKNEKITWRHIIIIGIAGLVVFLFNPWLLNLGMKYIYIATTILGYIAVMMAGVWMSRMLKNNMMDDRFNEENESFMQETRLLTNEYSVNLPTKFRYQGRMHDGWINVVNPFRATAVLGTPGSGKSYAVINNFIKQQIEKGFAMYIYDFKFPDLSVIAYNHLLRHRKNYTVAPKFYVLNFDDPRRSHRCNPINPKFMSDIADAYESAYVTMLNLNKTWITRAGDFFVESPIILLAAII